MNDGSITGAAAAPAGPNALAKFRHDLRTPLNQVIGFSELIMEVAEDDGLVGLDLPLQTIRRGGNDLLTLINEATSGWRVAAGHFDAEGLRAAAVDPLGVIERELIVCQQLATARGHVQIVQDLSKIRHATEDLLAQLRREDLASLAVPGANAAAAAGAGLTARPFPTEAEASNATAGRLLVVDDDRVNREMMTRRLAHMGFVVETAEDGREALERLRAADYDLVLLDILMPVMDGFETLQHIRANPLWSTLPVIMLTGLDDAESTGRCIAAGAEDCAPKPFNAVVLRARITSALEKKLLREREQLYQARIVELEAALALQQAVRRSSG